MNLYRMLFYKKILITLLLIVVYYIGTSIQMPGLVSYSVLNQPTILAHLNHALSSLSIFAMALSPYLSASIISQLLSSARGSFLHQLKEDQIVGVSKLNLFTKCLTVFVAVVQSIHMLDRINTIGQVNNIILIPKWMFFVINIPILTSGALLVVWLSNQISSKGLGKGVQIIMFVNLLMQAPQTIQRVWMLFRQSIITYKHLLVLTGFGLCLTFIILFVEETVRLIPVNYANLEVSKQEYLPLKINLSGAITVILANHIIQFIPLITNIIKKFVFTEILDRVVAIIYNKHYAYYIFYSTLIILLNMTYSHIVFDPINIAKHFHSQNKTIENVEPLQETVQYLENTTHYLNIISSIYLIIICVVAEYLMHIINNWIGTSIININGMTILIGVGITQTILSGLKNYNYSQYLEHYSN